ncbi:hypothetical protein GCM10009116_15560 [Brevundimonas basaltis]|uniref:Lipid/polyisoprenoid-binding YceI-like domain-containing protein n=1 Tax=Brevundimonas basaltis TaxID=472166 RepID=A0A7W8MGH2_9CAUL|nr:hypothetical protein [Brevundimonas basaltis]MBB5291132.1 hypothetical protein [Brevundimonas basaltis]
MHTRFLIAAALVAGLAVASCERTSGPPGTPAPAAYTHAVTTDISGYYMPADPVRIGDWSLDHVFIGQASEFQTWEGGARSETFAPVMLQFDDASSPMAATDPGEAHSVTARVLPTRYEVTDTAVIFEGRSPELGRVVFDGRLDPDALATSRRTLGGGDGAVMTGTLTADGRTVRDVGLRWWMGD